MRGFHMLETLILERSQQYARLIRLDKPIGIFLLLWPTLIAVWIASSGFPSLKIFLIFTAGVFIMRAAGCILNDLADRKFDPYVVRTSQRPLATGKVSVEEALALCVALLISGSVLLLFLNRLTFFIALMGITLTAFYPFTKRFTHLPQLVLGITWNLGILMAFAAILGKVTVQAWLLYAIGFIWTVAYDTMYGMADRTDDLKIGIKSTAILFGAQDRTIVAALQVAVLILLLILGVLLTANIYFYLAVVCAAGFFVDQQYLIRAREETNCLKAFLNNNWAWFAIFAGIFLNYI